MTPEQVLQLFKLAEPAPTALIDVKCQTRKSLLSSDHLVGNREQVRWNIDTKRRIARRRN